MPNSHSELIKKFVDDLESKIDNLNTTTNAVKIAVESVQLRLTV